MALPRMWGVDRMTDGTERIRLCPNCGSEDIKHDGNPSKRKTCNECGTRFYGAKLRFVEPDNERSEEGDCDV